MKNEYVTTLEFEKRLADEKHGLNNAFTVALTRIEEKVDGNRNRVERVEKDSISIVDSVKRQEENLRTHTKDEMGRFDDILKKLESIFKRQGEEDKEREKEKYDALLRSFESEKKHYGISMAVKVTVGIIGVISAIGYFS